MSYAESPDGKIRITPEIVQMTVQIMNKNHADKWEKANQEQREIMVEVSLGVALGLNVWQILEMDSNPFFRTATNVLAARYGEFFERTRKAGQS